MQVWAREHGRTLLDAVKTGRQTEPAQWMVGGWAIVRRRQASELGCEIGVLLWTHVRCTDTETHVPRYTRREAQVAVHLDEEI